MKISLNQKDVFGLIRPDIDSHTLGMDAVAALLRDCGQLVIVGKTDIASALSKLDNPNNASLVCSWLRKHKITRLGYSYRLDPQQGQFFFGKLMHLIKQNRLLSENSGPLRSILFAGLPETCQRIQNEYSGSVRVFIGDETPTQTLNILGVPTQNIPKFVRSESVYDGMRLAFGKQLIEEAAYKNYKPPDRSGYHGYGTSSDTLVSRLDHARIKEQLPLIRAHVGPYNSNYAEAVSQFSDWVIHLARSRLLDILSIGTSQLTQSHFGIPWGDLPNAGGVPINSEAEYQMLWKLGRPMLFRTYAGVANIPNLAKIHERSLSIAWHALSFWWFCQIDGRGPNTVLKNLEEHLKTLSFIASTNKPFEPNIPHHFAFRGSDDITYVVSAYLAAKTAKLLGVQHLVLQIMLNTPKFTTGVQDLAKARAMLRLVKELEDKRFRVFLQPRAGLGYFSPDLEKAKIQLAAVTALMDDIEPTNLHSPDIIHVVSFSEASHLADPKVINESIKITFSALKEYRHLRQKRKIDHMGWDKDVALRTEFLYIEAKTLINAIESLIQQPYTPQGLYQVFAAGFFSAPHLWEGADEFRHAVNWRTAFKNGGMQVVDEKNNPIPAIKRAAAATENLKSLQLPLDR